MVCGYIFAGEGNSQQTYVKTTTKEQNKRMADRPSGWRDCFNDNNDDDDYEPEPEPDPDAAAPAAPSTTPQVSVGRANSVATEPSMGRGRTVSCPATNLTFDDETDRPGMIQRPAQRGTETPLLNRITCERCGLPGPESDYVAKRNGFHMALIRLMEADHTWLAHSGYAFKVLFAKKRCTRLKSWTEYALVQQLTNGMPMPDVLLRAIMERFLWWRIVRGSFPC